MIGCYTKNPSDHGDTILTELVCVRVYVKSEPEQIRARYNKNSHGYCCVRGRRRKVSVETSAFQLIHRRSSPLGVPWPRRRCRKRIKGNASDRCIQKHTHTPTNTYIHPHQIHKPAHTHSSTGTHSRTNTRTLGTRRRNWSCV